MSVYLDFHFDKDFVGCTTGGAWIVPRSYSVHGDGMVRLSHDCCSMAELEHVLQGLEADIADIRKRAKATFAKKHKRAPVF